jgi:hypothetical protein
MILDKMTEFSSAQSIATTVGDLASTNIYDTGSAADVGVGEDLYLQINIGTAVTATGAGTVAFVLQTDADVAFGSPKEFVLTAAIAKGSLTLNSRQVLTRLPVGLERYLRVVYRIAGDTLTAGTASAFLTKDPQANTPIATTVPGVK